MITLWILIAIAFWLLTAIWLRTGGNPNMTFYPPRFTWLEALTWPLGWTWILLRVTAWVIATVEHQVWKRIVMQLLRIPAYARRWILRVPCEAMLHRPEFAVRMLSEPRLIRKWKRRKIIYNYMISNLRRDSRRRQAMYAAGEEPVGK